MHIHSKLWVLRTVVICSTVMKQCQNNLKINKHQNQSAEMPRSLWKCSRCFYFE